MDSLASLVDRQQTRLLQVHFPHDDGPEAGLLINRLDASEALSTDFVFTLELLSDAANLPNQTLAWRFVEESNSKTRNDR